MALGVPAKIGTWETSASIISVIKEIWFEVNPGDGVTMLPIVLASRADLTDWMADARGTSPLLVAFTY